MNDIKIILITGGSSGIGFQLSRLFSHIDGYKVYVTSRNIENLQELAECGNIEVKRLDVSVQDDINRVVGEILNKEEKIDVLVHCAGIGNFSPVESVSMNDVKNVVNINAVGLMALTTAILPSMKKRNMGHIIAVSAICGIIGFPFNSAYSASKFAVEGFCESITEELKHENIRVTLIEPGPVLTDFDAKTIRKMNEDHNLDNVTMKLMDTFKQKNDASYQTMSQSVDDVAQKIYQCIKDPECDQLRLVTNTIYNNALSHVFKVEDIKS